jgi:hypothetical protein
LDSIFQRFYLGHEVPVSLFIHRQFANYWITVHFGTLLLAAISSTRVFWFRCLLCLGSMGRASEDLSMSDVSPTRAVQATGHRRCDSERMMKFEQFTEYRPVGLQASA